MKRMLSPLLAVALSLAASAAGPWRTSLHNKEEQVTLQIDLYEETVDVPGMELLGPMNGYLGGRGIYGVWMVTSFEIKSDHTATLRLSNDLGSETQAAKLVQDSDSTYCLELQGNVVVKRSVNRKLVKIPQRMVLRTNNH